MNQLKPNKNRAQFAMVMIWIILGLDIVTFFSDYLQYRLIDGFSNGQDISMQAAESNDARTMLIVVIDNIAILISAIAFICWFRRAYNNLHLLGLHCEYSEGWAAGAWFVPILNLFRPYKIMKELYSKTEDVLSRNGSHHELNNNVISLWWTLWIVSGLINRFSFRLTSSADTLEEIQSATVLSMISCVIGIPLAIVTIKVIKNYSEVEPLLLDINQNIEDNQIEAEEVN